MTTATYIYNRSERLRVGDGTSGIIETAQPVSVADIVTTISQRSAGRFSVRAIYRRQLRMYRRMAQFIDQHNVISNLWTGGWGVVLFIYVIIYA